jgi:hypothetical protein
MVWKGYIQGISPSGWYVLKKNTSHMLPVVAGRGLGKYNSLIVIYVGLPYEYLRRLSNKGAYLCFGVLQ